MQKISNKLLKKLKTPNILIPGIIAASILLSATQAKTLQKKFDQIQNYNQLKQLFPATAVVKEIEDGDTFILNSGIKVRLIGIDAPSGKLTRSQNYLVETILNKKIYLEYDRYQDDKYGRILAWVWVDCESTPKFLPADYMHKSNNESNPGLLDNPEGCKQGKLINQEMVNTHLAHQVFYKDRGPLKYEARIKSQFR